MHAFVIVACLIFVAMMLAAVAKIVVGTGRELSRIDLGNHALIVVSVVAAGFGYWVWSATSRPVPPAVPPVLQSGIGR